MKNIQGGRSLNRLRRKSRRNNRMSLGIDNFAKHWILRRNNFDEGESRDRLGPGVLLFVEDREFTIGTNGVENGTHEIQTSGPVGEVRVLQEHMRRALRNVEQHSTCKFEHFAQILLQLVVQQVCRQVNQIGDDHQIEVDRRLE